MRLQCRLVGALEILDHHVHRRVAGATRHLGEDGAERPQVVRRPVPLALVLSAELGRRAARADRQLLVAHRGRRRREAEVGELEQVLVLLGVQNLGEDAVRCEVAVRDAARMAARERREQLIHERAEHHVGERPAEHRVRRALERAVHDPLQRRVDVLEGRVHPGARHVGVVLHARKLQRRDARVAHPLEAADPADKVVRDALVHAAADKRDGALTARRERARLPLVELALLARGRARRPARSALLGPLDDGERARLLVEQRDVGHRALAA